MPRPNRICFPGAVYHIFQRGNNKDSIFLEDIDNWHFLKLFLEAKEKFNFIIFCYALMKNHYHITIETQGEMSISKIMQHILGSYASYFNKKYDHKGHLFEGRFRDAIVEKDAYLLALSRYIHLNPVKAGIVKSPGQYTWSSYNVYIGQRQDKLISQKQVLSYFDALNENDARVKYKSFVENYMDEEDSASDWLEANLKRNKFLASMDFVKIFTKRGLTPFSPSQAVSPGGACRFSTTLGYGYNRSADS